MVGVLPAFAPLALIARALDKDGLRTTAFARRAARHISRSLPQVAAPAKNALNQAAASGALVVLADAAERELHFLPGHPQMDHAYAMHPLDSVRYLPFAQFHEVLFAQKVAEFVTLLAGLGATQITVRAARGFRESAALNTAIHAPWNAVSGADGASRVHTFVQRIELEERLIPRKDPEIPSGLLWFAHEPTWQALARRRLEYATDHCVAELAYDEDFGVDGGLALALERIGVRLGGSFRSFERTRWEFEVTFSQPTIIER